MVLFRSKCVVLFEFDADNEKDAKYRNDLLTSAIIGIDNFNALNIDSNVEKAISEVE
jgi:hypothetical protein